MATVDPCVHQNMPAACPICSPPSAEYRALFKHYEAERSGRMEFGRILGETQRIIDLLKRRVMDSRHKPDFSIVEIGFETDEEALEFHEAITA